MRQRAKLIVFAALSAALTVAGLSIAAGGGESGTSTKSSTKGERGFHSRQEMQIDRDVADVMRQIHEAVGKKAPEIADPIIQKAQDSGDITSDQADKLRAAAQAIADGKRPNVDRALLGDADVRKVVQDAFDAAHKQAPDIGEPIIQKALDDKKITSAQADQIRERLKNPPRFGGGPGRGPGGPGFDKHFDGPHGFGSIDKDVAAVLDDIHQAAEKKESAVAEPIIKKALDDGKITQAQADALRNHRPAGFDKDVFAVMRDIHKAAAKQVSAIAAPIIDKAVSDKKITESQANDIRDKLKNGPLFGKRVLRFRGGPPPFGGPGRPPGGAPPAPGNNPGAFPQGPPPDAQPAVAGRPA